jgi:uncharacterized protein YndB with AHSA1/START domain
MPASAASDLKMVPDDRVLLIERVFDAPRDVVWDAFTKPEHLIRWMGPRHHPAVKFEGDLRLGGKWRACLRAPDSGRELWQGGVFREIAPPERLVYTFQWDAHDEQDETFETLVTVTIEEVGKRSRVRVRQALFNTTSNRDGHVGGWNSALDRLEDLLGAL